MLTNVNKFQDAAKTTFLRYDIVNIKICLI